MFLGILTLITALAISAVAIYYSVAGLVAIFAAAAIPIMIMGTTLEIAKLVTAVWLHRYWRETTWWLKTYLSTAVIVLMFITSMGIFGFLSKAHIEQTANAQEGVAQIERIDLDISRQQSIVSKAEERIVEIESKGSNNDEKIQQQIDAEQQRIDSAYSRIQPAIDEQLTIISNAELELQSRIQPLLDQALNIEQTLSELSNALAKNQVRIAQGIVGAKQDGALGPDTSNKIQQYRITEEEKRNQLLAQVEQIRTAPQPTVEAARIEISRLRNIAEQQIADSDRLIARLRAQLGTQDTQAVQAAVDQQREKIQQANNTIDTLTQEKYALQIEYRKLEAEVGPVKYLAEFIYGETATQDLLEEAVRWVILIIIFVFDPLAVLLLIASQVTFETRRHKHVQEPLAIQEKLNDNKNINELRDESSYSTGDPSVDSKNSTTTNTEKRTVPINISAYADWIGTPDNGRSVERPSVELTEEQKQRAIEFENKENDVKLQDAKKIWKQENPDKTLKEQKELYIHGKIDKLPWETE